jgi:sialate O-acetylesterase
MRIGVSVRALLAAAMIALGAQAEVLVAGVFGSGMVLQRQQPVPIWGRATAGEAVAVEVVAGHRVIRASTVADAGGRWKVVLEPMEVGSAVTLRVRGVSSEVVLDNVLIGDVWLCSGQSNMAMGMAPLAKTRWASDLATAEFPEIRHGAVARSPSLEPEEDVVVRWTVCSPQSVGDMTATGFYFAREVYKRTGVPIGLVNSSWGGTSIEAWTSKAALDTVPELKQRAEGQIANLASLPGRIATFRARIEAWERANDRWDEGVAESARDWAAVELDTKDWKASSLSTRWSSLGLAGGGVVWIRKEVQLPASAEGQEFRLDFGLVDEQYTTTFFNGQLLGESGKTGPEFYARYVNYVVPGSLVRGGKNVVAVRMVSNIGEKSGITRSASMMGFRAVGGDGLDDSVMYRVEREFSPLTKEAVAARPVVPRGNIHSTASALYGGMIHPLAPMALKGVLWYQGEQDASPARGYLYRTSLPLMILDWRRRWGHPELPFYIVQLPNWLAGQKPGGPPPSANGWADLRESQYVTSEAVPNVYITCTVDVGDANDVHPLNKSEVGRRLALVALAKSYGQDVAHSGPRYRAAKIVGGEVRVSFDFADGLTTSDGEAPAMFSVAGADGRFVWAEARMDGQDVVVSAKDVPVPVAVRYAWKNSPDGANLINASGLPAFPFRTDDFPLGPEGRK